MTSYLIFLKFYYGIINFKDKNWPNLATSDHQDAKNQTFNILSNVKFLQELECGKIR